jgi:hypothetical protein
MADPTILPLDHLGERVAVIEQLARTTQTDVADLRVDLRALRADVSAEFRALRAEMKSDYRWLIGLMLGGYALTIGGFVTMFGLIGHGFKWF